MQANLPKRLADVIRLTSDSETVTELISGDVVKRALPTRAHDIVVERLQRLITGHVDLVDFGAVFRLPWPLELSKFDVVRPDLFVMAWDTGTLDVDGVTGAPGLIVEVADDVTRERDLGEKRRLYQWSGVAEYWVVDPAQRMVAAWTKGRNGFDPMPVDPASITSVLLAELTIAFGQIFD
jgi:Uma2 family endonuclease